MIRICINMRQILQNIGKKLSPKKLSLRKLSPKKLDPRQRQWLWFVGLWFGGLAAVLLLAQIIRLAMGLD